MTTYQEFMMVDGNKDFMTRKECHNTILYISIYHICIHEILLYMMDHLLNLHV